MRNLDVNISIASSKVVQDKVTSNILTDTILETGASGVPSKSQKSFICGGVGQTITLKSPGKGAPPSTPSRGLQWLPLFWMQYIKPSLPSRIGFLIFFRQVATDTTQYAKAGSE